jgi:hypothetical protein
MERVFFTTNASNVSNIPGVPDGGTTIVLLGFAMTGIAAVRRKLRVVA